MKLSAVSEYIVRISIDIFMHLKGRVSTDRLLQVTIRPIVETHRYAQKKI